MTKPKGKFYLDNVSPSIIIVIIITVIIIKYDNGTVFSRLWFELTFLMCFGRQHL